MVLLHGTPPPPDRPWQDAPHVEFRLYKDPIKMARSYHSLMVTLKRLVIRESGNEAKGTNFVTNKDSISTTTGRFYVHRIPQLPVTKEKYFVVVLYPPTDLSEEDVPMNGDKPIKLLFNFSSFYLIGFSYNEIWHVFNDAMIIGISKAARDMYVKNLPFAGNYNAIGQNYLELVVGFTGQCDTYNSLSDFGRTTTEGQLIRSLCRTTITVPESTRFYFLQQFNLGSFYSGNLDIVLDSPVPKNEEYKNFSLHLTKWNLYSTISKNGENLFSITSIPTSGIYSFNAVMNFIALATNKEGDEDKKMLEHGRYTKHNSSDDHTDHNEMGDQGRDNDEEDARDNRRIDQDNNQTWFYQAPVMAYVPRRQFFFLIPELGLEIPPEAQRGTLSTVKGGDIRAVDELDALQDETKAEAIDQFFMELRYLGSVEAASTFISDYPSGKGFIDNRTSELQAALCFPAEPTKEPGESSQDASMVGACSGGMKIIPHGSVGTVAGPCAIAQGNSNEITAELCRYSAPEEVGTLLSACVACASECATRLFSTSTKIPYFREVIVTSTTCDLSGYCNLELKPGGFAAKGKKTTLHVKNVKDLSRDVMKVAVAKTAQAIPAELMPKPLCGPDIVEVAVDAKCAQDWYPATVEDRHRSSSSHHRHHDLDDGQHQYPLGRVGIEA